MMADGDFYDFHVDETKAKTCAQKLYVIFKDKQWHTTNEILGSTLQVSHRFACGVKHLRDEGFKIETRKDKDGGGKYLMYARVPVEKTTKELKELYYKSNHWRSTRKKRLVHDNYCCCNCKLREDLHVHHWRYDLFQEDLLDLMTLCKDCHEKVHDNYLIKLAFPRSIPADMANELRANR